VNFLSIQEINLKFQNYFPTYFIFNFKSERVYNIVAFQNRLFYYIDQFRLFIFYVDNKNILNFLGTTFRFQLSLHFCEDVNQLVYLENIWDFILHYNNI